MRIAFYAPLKGPDHPVPSGDREMARMLMRALRAGGHEVDLVSTLRSFAADPEPARLAAIEAAAEAEVDRIAALWAETGAVRPDLWFTYHPFYKAPDLIGPDLARRFGMAYATAEASNAPKRAAGPWSAWHGRIEAAIRAGGVHFCFTDRDRSGLERLLGSGERIVSLRPFIDAAPSAPRAPRRQGETVALIAVAMMRHGDKLRSYAALAQAAGSLPAGANWHLTIVGDGPASHEVRQHFATVPADRISWRGELPPCGVDAALRAADLFVWPGFNEAFGVAYLEAGARGLPILAFDSGGISSVVEDGSTGRLVPEGDVEAYAAALAALIGDRPLRDRWGEAAETMVRTERSLAVAADSLSRGLARAASMAIDA